MGIWLSNFGQQRKQFEAGEVPGKPSKVKAEFVAKMFSVYQARQKYAKRDRQDPIRPFNHQMHVARRLSDLVTHFGCGELLYPGFDCWNVHVVLIEEEENLVLTSGSY